MSALTLNQENGSMLDIWANGFKSGNISETQLRQEKNNISRRGDLRLPKHQGSLKHFVLNCLSFFCIYLCVFNPQNKMPVCERFAFLTYFIFIFFLFYVCYFSSCKSVGCQSPTTNATRSKNTKCFIECFAFWLTLTA